MARRIFVAIPLVLVGIALIGYGTIALRSDHLVDHTVDNSRQIQAMSHFNVMKQFSILGTLAPARRGLSLSR